VYHALWQASMGRVTPRDADELEIWEIAVLLGHAHELDTPEEGRKRRTGHGLDPAAARRQRAAAAAERNRLRLAASRGEAPAPEAEPVDTGTLHQLGGALNRGSPRNP
jgi:hypothetical protein